MENEIMYDLYDIGFTTNEGKFDETQIDVDSALDPLEMAKEIANTILSLHEEMNIGIIRYISFAGRRYEDDRGIAWIRFRFEKEGESFIAKVVNNDNLPLEEIRSRIEDSLVGNIERIDDEKVDFLSRTEMKDLIRESLDDAKIELAHLFVDDTNNMTNCFITI